MHSEIDPDYKRNALNNHTFKNLDDKIYVQLELNHRIPQLRYFHREQDFILEGWPSLKHYLVREDGSQKLTQTSPLLDLRNATIGIFTPLERGNLHYLPEYSEWWENHELQVKDDIREFLCTFPLEVWDTFKDWNPFPTYTWKALQASSRHERFFQLCQTNPSLAFLLLQRSFWDKNHPLASKKYYEVLGEKQSTLAELLGFKKKHWKILRKVHPGSFRTIVFSRLKELLEIPRIENILYQLKQITEMEIQFLRMVHSRGFLDALEVSFVQDFSHNHRDIDKGYVFRKANLVTRYGGYVNLCYFGEQIYYQWRECVRHNPNWRIRSEESLWNHEQRMIDDLNAIQEDVAIRDNKIFCEPPIPGKTWNQLELFTEEKLTYAKISPITSSYELYLAGKRFRNCAYSYTEEIYSQEIYFYILEWEEEEFMIAVGCTFGEEDDFYMDLGMDSIMDENLFFIQEWIEGENPERHWYLTEVKGYRNSLPPKEVMGILENWFAWAKTQSPA